MKTPLVMINYNGGDMTLATIASLYEHTPPDSFKLYLVDNASEDGVAAQVKEKYPEVELILSNKNLGFGKGNNMALIKIIAEKQYKYVGLINNDLVFTDNWLQELIAVMEQKHNAAAVNPLILYANKFKQINVNTSDPELYIHAEDYRFMGRIVGEVDSPARELILDSTSFIKPGRKEFSGWINSESDKLNLTFYDEKLTSYAVNLGGVAVTRSKLISFLRKVAFKLLDKLTLKLQKVSIPVSELAVVGTDMEVVNAYGSKLLPSGYPVNNYYGQPRQAVTENLQQTDLFYGAAALLRVSTLEAAGLFDADYFMYFEESDLSMRLREFNYEFYATANSIVYHKEGGARSEKTLQYQKDSEAIYFRKWQKRFTKSASTTR